MDQVGSLVTAVLVVLALGGGPMVTAADTTTLTVAVQDRGGSAVGSATITATWDNGSTSATTANNGKAFVDVPDDKRVELTVDHPDYTLNFPYVVSNPGNVDGDVTVEVGAKSSLALTVEDGDGPVENAQVAIRWNGRIVRSGTTNANGVIETNTIEAGEYSVNVLKQGYYEKRTTVTASGTTAATVTIESGSVPFEFNVTDSHFDPPRAVAGATIRLEGIGAFDTVQDGLATGRIPVNTEVEMTVTKDGYETVTRTLDVDEAGKTISIDLQRTPALTVKPANQRIVAGETVVVTVRDEYGIPVAGATVRRNGTDVATTDENGQVAVPLEEAGTYAISASKNGLTANEVTVEAVNPADTDSTTTTESPTTTTTDEPTSQTETTDVDIPGFTMPIAMTGIAVALGIGLLHRRR